MEFFERAKVVRLRSEKGKYLMADEDEVSVFQHRHGSSRAARWTVELFAESGVVRLKSLYGNYLTAGHDREPFGFTLHGPKRKVVQTDTRQRPDYSAVDWEPIREGNLVKLRSRQGTFLRANGPWRSSVTHDVISHHQSKGTLWDVAVLDIIVTDAPVKKIPCPGE